ncbi:MAG: type II toxin-antitoxin system HicA family toxin [Chloroflexi bacterium]|nr:type II toxin-antitoxin system HicA family toxin [Chloroflexota bacterium]
MRNVAFADVMDLVEGLGFYQARVSGSHHIFAHRYIPELILTIRPRPSQTQSDSAVHTDR